MPGYSGSASASSAQQAEQSIGQGGSAEIGSIVQNSGAAPALSTFFEPGGSSNTLMLVGIGAGVIILLVVLLGKR